MRKIAVLTVLFLATGCVAAPMDSTEVVVDYGGWSMNQLLQTPDGREFLKFADESYKNESWANTMFSQSTYRFSAESQKTFVVPVTVLATALLAHRQKHGGVNFKDNTNDPLLRMADKTSCKQLKAPEGMIGLYWSEGRFVIDKNYCAVQGGGVWEAKM